MREHIIYAKDPVEFRRQFNQFIDDNPEIEIRTIRPPDQLNRQIKHWTYLYDIILSVIYE